MELRRVLGTTRHYAYRVTLFSLLGFLTVAEPLPWLFPNAVPDLAAVSRVLLVVLVGSFAVGVGCSVVGWLDVQYGLATQRSES